MFASSDLRIISPSPCIDAGNNDALPRDSLDVDDDGDTTELIPWDRASKLRRADDPAVDPDPGNAGIVGPPIVDMGAYEVSPLFVDDNASSEGDGRSWATAYKYLQDALYVAADPLSGMGEIRVAQGTYCPDQDEGGHVTPADREATFEMQNNLAIRGGYRGAFSGGGNPDDRDITVFETILSGDYANDDDPNDPNSNNENSYHIVTGSGTIATAVLEGFTITAGNADNIMNYYGGGMYNNEGGPTVTDCTFSGNWAAEEGGGGGMSNTASSPVVTNCIFSNNSAGNGGGMLNHWGSSPIIINCTFTGNSARYYGGGIENDTGTAMVINCIFSGNSAVYGGGIKSGFARPTVINCTFSGNSAAEGGGVWVTTTYEGQTLNLTNCILWGNSDSNGVGESAQFFVDPNAEPNAVFVAYSCIQDCSSYCLDPNYQNIGEDPPFLLEPNNGGDGWGDDPCTPLVDEGANDDYGDLRLTAGSPCVDTGNNDADTDASTPEIDPLPETDLDGRPRFADGDCNDTNTVDMGAYEFTSTYIGDFDVDCDVDFAAYAIFADYWLTDELLVDIAPTPAGDGIIDERDLNILCDNWLFGK